MSQTLKKWKHSIKLKHRKLTYFDQVKSHQGEEKIDLTEGCHVKGEEETREEREVWTSGKASNDPYNSK